MNFLIRRFCISLSIILGISGGLIFSIISGVARSTASNITHTWSLLPIDTISNRYDKSRISMEVDAQGRTHLVYRRYDQLHYDRIDGITIDSQVLTVTPTIVDYSLALDPQYQPHLAIIQNLGSSGLLLYGSLSGHTWSFETLSVLGEYNYYGLTYSVSLAFDENGKPHISYPASYTVLAYATNPGGGWITRMVDTNLMGTSSTTLAVSPAGVPSIAYEYADWSSLVEKLNYAVWNGSDWDIQPFDQHFGYIGEPKKLARMRLDSSAKPHVLYFKDSVSGPSWKTPFYAKLEGSIWMTEVITTMATAPWGDLALDINDQPHIVFAGAYGEGGVFYGVRNENGWEIESATDVDPSFFGGAGASIAIDPLRGRIRLGFEECYFNEVYIASYADHFMYLPNVGRPFYPDRRATPQE